MLWFEKLMIGIFVTVFVGALTYTVVTAIQNPPAPIFWMLIEEEE